MINLNQLRCQNHQEFYGILQELNQTLEKNVSNEGLCKISEFFKNNKDLIIGNPQTTTLLKSIRAKVCHSHSKDHPNLHTQIQKIIRSSNRKQIEIHLQFFRTSISNPSQHLQIMAHWITQMNIPLADLDLSVEELAGLLVRLEHIDLTDYNFEVHDLDLFAEILLKFSLTFRTRDTNVLGTIARVCAKQKGTMTAFYIKNFEIKDPAVRADVARLCIKKNGGFIAQLIKKFEIVDRDTLVEIARLCAKDNGGGTAQHFKNFEIIDPLIRIEIARLCAMQCGWGTAQHFKNFEIDDPEIRLEIAHLCAKINSPGTALYIENFKIPHTNDRLEVLFECAMLDPESLFCMENFSPLPDVFTKLPGFIQILKSNEPDISLRSELFKELNQLIPKLPFSNICRDILINTSKEIWALPPHSQNVAGLWLLASILVMNSLKTDAVEWMMQHGMWKELALLRDPALRVRLTRGLYELSANEERRIPWESFLSSVSGKEGQKGFMLLPIPFFALEKEGLERKCLIEVATTLTKYQNEKNSQLRAVHHVKNMLHTLQALACNDDFKPEIKKAAFEKIFSLSNEKTIIRNIIAAKGLLQLKDTEWPTCSEDLSVLFRHSLEKVFPLQNCQENLSEQYDDIFASCRNPDGLLIYAAGLKALGETEVITCLGRYVATVLNGTFKEVRYDPEDNPHLTKILKFDVSLLEKWKEELSFDLETLTSSESSPISFNPMEWLKTKLITDQHLGDTELTFVNQYLKQDSDKKGVFQDLVAQINLSRKEKEIAQLRGNIDELKKKNLRTVEVKKVLKSLSEEVSANPELAKLNLQKACLNFIKKGQGAEKNVLINLLMEIDKALKQETNPPTTFAESEFAEDIKGLLEGFEEELKSKGKPKEGLKVLFTDDPIDLLLCGTDVSGSCQRLDGDSSLNMGLLGYLMDGKNRLLAIKEGDKIIARCILGLLWDGEQPVIYRERFYPDTNPDNYKNALNALAKMVATNLGVPLTSNDADDPYGKKLEALGGPAPYEYSDGAGGVQTDGCYTILDAKLLGALTI